MKRGLKYIAAWACGALACVMIASFFSTQRVIGALVDAGGSVGFSERLSMIFYDMSHFGSMYAVFVLIAFLIAFLAGGLVFRLAKFGRPVVYVAAGAAAMLVMLLLMEQAFFGVPIVGGARDAGGLIMQMLAGALGGLVFHKLSKPLAT